MAVQDPKTIYVPAHEPDRHAATALATSSPSTVYDARYRAGYQRELVASGYDACVLAAVRWALDRELPGGDGVRNLLDYGCGQGRYLDLLSGTYPNAKLIGSEISAEAISRAALRVPSAELVRVDDESVPLPDGSVELVLCIEVIEHVVDAPSAAREIGRLLRPGGTAVVTAPCANPLSAGWLFNLVGGGFEETADGYGRFRTDDAAHLRRLRSRELRELFEAAGFSVRAVRFWGHLGTALADNVPFLSSRSLSFRRRLALFDWHLARRLPNAAAMVLIAERQGGGG